MEEGNKGLVPTGDEIVISGISGCFPAADNIDEFQKKLFNKEDLVRPKEESHWKNEKLGVPNYVGQVSNKNKFDAGFFGVNPKHCASTDPFVRMLLEKVFEAIVDAGVNPSELHGTNTAVFTGSNISESENTYIYIPVKNNLAVMGHSRAMVSNRISYWLDVHGTSISMVSMETTGFEALSAACNEMRKGRCDAAVVGAVNLVMHPEMSYHYNELGVLSKDGKTKAFDEGADGYARSEGVVAMFLQRARDARRIYATVVNAEFDAFGNRDIGYTTPYGAPLANLMKHFYDSCGIDPNDIDYLEAEGLGTKFGDEEEMRAVDEVLLHNRKAPLLIGSVKSNMGHGNAAANFCSVAKVLIAMQSGAIPPNLHFTTPSHRIEALIQRRAQVVTETTPWKGGLVALNSMGMTGTYAHVLLQSLGNDKENNVHNDSLPRLIVTSSRTEDGVTTILNKLEGKPIDVEYIHLLHHVHASNIHNHLYRGYTIVPTLENSFHEVQHYDLSSRPVWFIFSGMGSQWATMGKELMKLPVCAKAIDKCHNILLEKNLDLKHIITTHDGKVFDNILHSFIGIAAIQIALVDMLKAIGITPDGMVGHSVGELGCAYADECLTLKQMILSAYYRGLASLQAELIPGSMAAVGLGHARINKLVPPEIDIACHNSFDSCTLSGPVDIVNDFVEYLKSRNIFAKAVNVSNIAYHSRYIKPAAPLLLESLKQLLPDPKPRSNRWVSSSIPEEDWNTPLAQTCSPEYLTNNLLSSVLFEEASKHIPKNAITIEIAPHGLLQAILRRSLPPECTNIALTQRGHKQGLYFLLSAIGKLYLMGLSPQLKELYPPVQLPVSRGTPSISPLVRWDHCDSWYTVGEVDNSALISGEREVLVNLNKEEFRTYADHIVDGQIFFPAFGYLKLVWDTLAILKETTLNKLPIVFENVKFLRHTHIAERGSQMLTINVQRGSGKFEISSDNELVVTGTVLIPQNVADCYSQLPTVPSGGIELPGEDIYAELEQRGYGYNGNFKGIKKVRINSQGSIATVNLNNHWVLFGETLLQLMLLHSGEPNQSLHMPSTLQKVVFDPAKHTSETAELVAAYNYATDIIHCGGMEIQRLKTVTFTRQQLTINFEALQFVEFSNPKLQSMEQFISMSVQMTLENSSSKKIVSVLVLSATDIRSKIKFLTHKYPQIALDMEIHPEKIYNLIVVTRQKDLPMAVPLICANGGFLLARMEGIKWHVNSDLVPVVSQMFENKEYVLYRKVCLQNGHTPQVLHLDSKSSTWLQQIRNAGPCHHLLAVVQLNDQGVEILPVVEQITKLDFHYVRYLFMLDDQEFSLNDSVYNKIKQLDLMVNVIYNGEWGSFCFLPLENSNKFYENSLPSVHRMQGIDISFLGINSSLLSKYVEESSVKTEKEFDSLDFSGYSKSGQKVMGMAAWHHEDKRLYSDKQLTWTVPESWNLQDAATVPVAYTMAYYPLEMLAKCRNGGTVLVIGGCTYIGQAAISLAADLGYVIFTTVANNEQKMFIKQNFPKFLDLHVYSNGDANFETSLMKVTEGKGVNIILNCLSGENIQSSLTYLASHGYYFHYGLSQQNSKQSPIAMGIFLNCVEFNAISEKNIFELSSESKKSLHLGVQNKIERGVVKPLQCSVFNKEQSQLALRSLADTSINSKVLLSMSETDNDSMPQTSLVHDQKSFYLVVGSEVKQCLDVVEWLVQQGVHQVAVTTKNDGVSKLAEHRIKLMHSYRNAKVIFFKARTLTCTDSVLQLLQEASSVFTGPLEGIFVLPLDLNGQENGKSILAVTSLDRAIRGCKTVKHFVCLLMRNSWNICERRHREGLPALSVFWNQHGHKHFNFRRSLRILNRLITSKIHTPVLIVTETSKKIEERNRGIPSLESFLPTTLMGVKNFGEDIESCSAWWEELPSLSPGYGEVKEIPPIFIIPGLQGPPAEILKPLTRNLMYPVFCSRLVEIGTSINDAASVLVKKIKDKQRAGSFNLVGVSWGGILTLEIARLLEAEGHRTRVVLIDGAPETILTALSQLKREGSIDANLISTLLQTKFTDIIKIENWDQLVSNALERLPEIIKSPVSVALSYIRSCVKMVLEYKPSIELLKGEICLIRPSEGSEDDNCGLVQFFKHTVNIHIVEGDHMTMLSCCKTANIVNDFIL
uniref:Fatty acid synthase 5 n=1 Tax=Blattella germanica TaxID=6973 RepID=A0A5B7QSH3_BLAGE|nr:fatty acid synthase 5 [Blattella germanica]